MRRNIYALFLGGLAILAVSSLAIYVDTFSLMEVKECLMMKDFNGVGRGIPIGYLLIIISPILYFLKK